MKKKVNLGVLYVVLSAICFATGGVLIKSVSWSSVCINGVRCLFALPMMLGFMKITRHKFVFNKAVLFGAVANLAMSLTFVSATKLTTAANAIVLQFTMPAFLIVFLLLFWKQKPDALQLITVFASFVGILFFFYESLSGGGMLGNILAVISGAFYAVVFLLKKIPDADFESSVVLSYIASFLICIPFLFRETDFGAGNLLGVLALGIVQIGCAYIFLTLGLSSVQPVAASLISMIEPVLNPIMVALVLGETIGWISLCGAVIVLGSATVYNVINARRSEICSEENIC